MDQGWTNYVAWLILLVNLMCINHVWLHNSGRDLLELILHKHYKHVCPIFFSSSRAQRASSRAAHELKRAEAYQPTTMNPEDDDADLEVYTYSINM